MYTFENLKEDVAKEAAALKVHATKEELAELNFHTLNPQSTRGCIYGRMTGHCHSDRAVQLIEKCACRFIQDAGFSNISDDGFIRIQQNVNGTSVKNLFLNRQTMSHGVTHYSAIEAYILLPEAKNANLIAYLKSETETLNL